ncbi:uncharacterized protein DUF1801 [Lutibacter sp. Hel_I_33_5]|uniref:DUF1801 domain-containing protein n=1 Tax=Lutibacter sp. Hel_I_33_5 TaxID=1566289 RepID=UPI00119F131B|nr:DUF1801 domain-containing protein [Lutibacter sp. Hel_I_33_5]TVZ56946.1 uncharacterized protein DUF1801 [Lutibacter sp. Hel_I_33_5]
MNPAEDFILNQPEPFKSMLLHLQILIETQFKEVDLKFKWKIPFYYLNDKPLCYLNPSKKKGYVDVAFYSNKAFDLYDEHVITENRKVVKSLRYKNLEEIDAQVLSSVLEEAFNQTTKGFFGK